MMSKKRTIIITGAVIVVIAIVIGLFARPQKPYGYATIDFNLPDLQNIDATVNSKRLAIISSKATYQLPVGQDTLIITKPAYKQFETSFDLNKGEMVVVSVTMQSTAPQAPAVANSQLSSGLDGYLPAGFSLVQATYFYQNTWAVALVTKGEDEAVLVAQYVGGGTPWKTVLGPGTVFTPDDLAAIPSSVSDYLNQQGYVLEEVPAQ